MKVTVWVAYHTLEALRKERYTEVKCWLREPGIHAGPVVQVSLDYHTFINLMDAL